MNKEKDVRICPVCEREVERSEMNFTKDCHGIPFRLVCWECYLKLMEKVTTGNITTNQTNRSKMIIKRRGT